MKKITIILVMCFMSAISMAQAPQAFAFQSTLKDTLGNPYVNDTIDVQFDIRNGSGTGIVEYSETHNNVITSASGYFSANVGQGTPSISTFSAINWATSSYWLEVLVDGNSLGSSQLLSVPYALNAGKPASAYKGIITDSSTSPGTILFDSTLINIGGDYNGLTGIYTVPETGVYMVSIAAVNGDGLIFYNGNVALINGQPNINPCTGQLSFDNNIFQFNVGDELHVDGDCWSNGTLGYGYFQIIQIK